MIETLADTTDLRPINGNILVRDDIKEDVTKGGIYIPSDTIHKNIVSGTVLDISNRKTDDGKIIQPEVVPGDKVLYKFVAGAGSAWKTDDGITVRMIKEIEILAKLEKDTKE